METLDWQKLSKDVSSGVNKVVYSSNKHLFRRVGFDVFQLKGGPVDSLWLLEEDENGTQYLAAQYDEDSKSEPSIEAKSHWTALSDKEGSNVTLLYKNTPIQRFASSEFGFSSNDVHLFQDVLVEKLASDKEFKEKFLKSLSTEKRDALLNQFPELV